LLYLWLRFDVYSIPAGYDVMAPSYRPHDSVLVDRLYEYLPGFAEALQPGDVVLFVDVTADGRRREALARVYAVPGQRVTVIDGGYAIDGQPLPPYGPRPQGRHGETLPSPGVVPEGHLFVLVENDAAAAP